MRNSTLTIATPRTRALQLSCTPTAGESVLNSSAPGNAAPKNSMLTGQATAWTHASRLAANYLTTIDNDDAVPAFPAGRGSYTTKQDRPPRRELR